VPEAESIVQQFVNAAANAEVRVTVVVNDLTATIASLQGEKATLQAQLVNGVLTATQVTAIQEAIASLDAICPTATP
jgi:hypothetical protein